MNRDEASDTLFYDNLVPDRCDLHMRVPRSFGRVLHVVENLGRSAVDSWLVRMLEHAHKKRIDVNWTFYCVLAQPGAMDENARLLGARVIHSPVPLVKKAEFVRELRAEVLH